MTTEQSAEQAETAEKMGLMLRAEDGTTYVIPRSVVEACRLPDEQRAALETCLDADGDDTQGHYLDSNGNFIGRFEMTRPQVNRVTVPGFGTFTAVQMVPYQGWSGQNPYPNGYPGLR